MSERHIYRLQMAAQLGADGRFYVIDFECKHPSVAAIHQELREAGVVIGSKLVWRKEDSGDRTIIGRNEFLFGTAGIIAIEPTRLTYLEARP
ncbi:hypothetical protein MAUB1S_09688 [Mycolicibacterium aubagnense]